jgi:hypothetical protein
MNDRSDFFYPRSQYHGAVKPENLVFNANLQEFAQRIGVICALQTNGKISVEDAYEQIHQLWQQLKQSKEALGIGRSALE